MSGVTNKLHDILIREYLKKNYKNKTFEKLVKEVNSLYGLNLSKRSIQQRMSGLRISQERGLRLSIKTKIGGGNYWDKLINQKLKSFGWDRESDMEDYKPVRINYNLVMFIAESWNSEEFSNAIRKKLGDK